MLNRAALLSITFTALIAFMPIIVAIFETKCSPEIGFGHGRKADIAAFLFWLADSFAV